MEFAIHKGLSRLNKSLEESPFALGSWCMGELSFGICVPSGDAFEFDAIAVAEIELGVRSLREHLKEKTNDDLPDANALVTGSEKNEGDKQKPRGGGRKKLGDSKVPELVARHNVYQLVRAEKERNPEWGPKRLFDHFKDHKDFKNQVTTSGLTLGLAPFSNALKWIRDNPATGTAQELNSGT